MTGATKSAMDSSDGLAQIACDSTEQGIGVGVVAADYENHLPDDIKDEWRDPWHFLVFTVLSMLVGIPKFFNSRPPAPIYCLFDRKRKFVEMASTIFYATKDDSEIDSFHLLGDMGFGSKEGCVPLQVADMLAYSVVRNWIEVRHNQTAPMFKTLAVLNQKQKLWTRLLNPELLTKYVSFVRERQNAEK
jgi:hypothetical protein